MFGVSDVGVVVRRGQEKSGVGAPLCHRTPKFPACGSYGLLGERWFFRVGVDF